MTNSAVASATYIIKWFTWTDQTPSGAAHNQVWLSIASSSDGTHLAAVVYGGDIWTGVQAP